MAFTDAEMAVLSQLAYYGSDYKKQNQPVKGQTLHSVLVDVKIQSYLDSRLGKGYKSTLEELVRKVDGKDYRIEKAEDDRKGTGFAAIAIRDPDGYVTVAARGTEGFNVFTSEASRRDVDDDVALAFSISTEQQEKMEQFMQSLEEDDHKGYYFTGHSLGGNLANYGAITLEPIDKVQKVVVFNAPGFNDSFITNHLSEIKRIHNQVISYQNEYDYVSSLLNATGQVVVVESGLNDS